MLPFVSENAACAFESFADRAKIYTAESFGNTHRNIVRKGILRRKRILIKEIDKDFFIIDIDYPAFPDFRAHVFSQLDGAISVSCGWRQDFYHKRCYGFRTFTSSVSLNASHLNIRLKLCFAVTAYLMLQLNNLHALIRIYSRIVSCSFLLLSCACCFLFPSIRGGILQMGVVAMYTILLFGYQDRGAAGKTFYAFVFYGIASMAYADLLYFLPLIWLLMGTNLLMLSWRTWGASVLGVLTPYWFAFGWLMWQGDPTPLADHLATMTDFQFPVNYARLGISFMSVVALLIVCTITGIIHYLK